MTSLLEQIFKECNDRGILTSFNESCCDTCNAFDLEEKLEQQPHMIGYVFAHAQAVDSLMNEITGFVKGENSLLENGEGLVYFGFDSRTKKGMKNIGYAFASIVKKHGLKIQWGEKTSTKVGVYLREEHLPEGSVYRWQNEQRGWDEVDLNTDDIENGRMGLPYLGRVN